MLIEQILALILTGRAVEHIEMAAVAQPARQYLLAHQSILLINAYTDKQNGDDLATLIFYRLILRDVAVAEQRGQAAVDFALMHTLPGGTAAVKLRTNCATAILFFQRG